jgi:hypothetical protein
MLEDVKFLASLLAKRATWGIAAAVLCLAGGGRLISDEVALQRQVAAINDYESLYRRSLDEYHRADVAHEAAKRTLALAVVERDGLAEQFSSSSERIQSLERAELSARQALDSAQRALTQLRGSADRSQEALAASESRRQALRGERDRLRRETRLAAQSLKEAQALARRVRQRWLSAQARTKALDERLRLSQTQLTRMALELLTAKQEAQVRERDLDTQRRELAAVRRDLAAQRRSLAAIEAKLTQSEARAKASAETLRKLEAAGVNVARLTGTRPMPKLRALVVQVDVKQVPPRVLVDAGKRQGLEVGDSLYLIRDGRSVGRLEIDEVQPELSTCRLVQGKGGLAPRAGDLDKTTPKP